MMDDEDWEPSRLMTRANDAGTDRTYSCLNLRYVVTTIIYIFSPDFRRDVSAGIIYLHIACDVVQRAEAQRARTSEAKEFFR